MAPKKALEEAPKIIVVKIEGQTSGEVIITPGGLGEPIHWRVAPTEEGFGLIKVEERHLELVLAHIPGSSVIQSATPTEEEK